MPLHGAMLLLDLPGPKLRLVCGKCGLRRQYDIQALVNKIGNAMVPGLLDELALRNGCAKIPAPTISDRCGLHLADDGE